MKRRDFFAFKKPFRDKPYQFPNHETVGFATAEKTAFNLAERPPVLSGLAPYTGPWNLAQASHLLRRTTFGAKWEDIQQLISIGMNASVDALLADFDTALDEPVNDYNNADYTDPDVPYGQSFIQAPWNVEAEGSRIYSLKSWWLRKMAQQDLTIGEKMILFWHNHLPVEFYGVFFARWNYFYYKTLRQYGLKNFKDLIRAITLDPAMLHYLNNQLNSAAAPDENYARELQELFCIGKGPNAKFTEGDVQAMARILTGWRYDYATEQVHFAWWVHDTNDKQLSSFYNNAVITGKSGPAGAEELDELLDLIFDQEEVALFICRKLYRFFVYHDIDDLTEQNVISPLAAIFRDNQYEILPVLHSLFKSQHFYDQLNKGVLLKSGLDYLVGLVREMHVALPPAGAYRDQYQISSALVYFGGLLQQDLGDPPNVSGWPAYYQIPQFDKHWISTNTLPYRLQIADLMLVNGLESENFTSQLDLLETTRQIPDAEDPNKFIDNTLAWLYGITVSPAVKLVLKSILLSGQLSDYYWTNAWLEYVADPDDAMKKETVLRRLAGYYYYIFHLEEHQLS